MVSSKVAKQEVKSLAIVRLHQAGSGAVESARQRLESHEGVSNVEVDHLRHTVRVEYDSDEITFDQIRSVLRSVA